MYLAESESEPEIVALRKESVDRNLPYLSMAQVCQGRSPQGERG